MGAEQSNESKKKADEKYERMLKNALNQQRQMYEEKYKDMLKDQQKKKVVLIKLNEGGAAQSSQTIVQTQISHTPLYPSVQQIQTDVKVQPSTSSSLREQTSHISNQTKPSSDEKYEKMIQDALNQQRKMYEEKYAELLKDQQKNEAAIKNLTERSAIKNSPIIVQKHTSYAPLYPNVQQVHTDLKVQQSTSTVSFQGQTENMSNQTKPFGSQHNAPTAPTDVETFATTKVKNTVNTKSKKNSNNPYQCPTCKKNSLEVNIFQCQQGHSSCSECRSNMIKCGVCRSPITNTRNFELEKVVLKFEKKTDTERINCPNKSDGCRLYFTPEKLPAHLKDCLFKEMECPLHSVTYTACSWRGKINHVQAHFLECHPDETGANVDTEMCFDRNYNLYIVRHVAMGVFNFLVHVKLDIKLQVILMSVELIGSLVSASKWTYEFHVYNKSEPRRKYVYGDTCLPISNNITDASKVSNCAVLPLQYALSFFKDNKLTYKFYIKKDEIKRGCPNKRGNRLNSVQLED